MIGVLGCAAAIFVACGDSNGLLPGDQANKLSTALDGVSAACQGGDVTRAQAAAARFGDEVAGLSAASVDRRLIRGLRQGASTLEELVVECDQETIPTTVVTTPETTPTTPATTTPAETTPVEPPVTTPTTPPETTPTTPPDTGGGTTTPPDTGGGTTPPDTGGETPPDTGDTGDPSQPDVNQGNPGGALAPGQGGTP
ncbi:hypothetical protein VSS74_02110 [Conexibacter stalactiti]|uniref:Uncharacterized protein n=1 Tax=Conexibacter stalactiti TaxID=1940611 RepID=A0ABU4HK84_9ACTN|nr:hypothetical protein [Conexibacter stalactiti]MDW5593114.1 hypothetical protein [Conexibacter stalactiti]MEC5033755.1 hypothetical protein [Conexibacter stalactiti]